MYIFDSPDITTLINLAIAEDLGTGDITSELTIPPRSKSRARMFVRQDCILAGQPVAERIFRRIDPEIEYVHDAEDGEIIQAGRTIALISGATRSILAGERLALNFLQRLSGIATATHESVLACRGTRCRVCDTRKTTPGWRMLEKYAVRKGGGHNHRMSLGDGILLKENHIRTAGGITQAVRRAQNHRRHLMKIQVEVTTEVEAAEAVQSGVDAILLDNMPPDKIRKITERFQDKVLIEASGNITPDNIREYAETGIHIASMGYLTHSAPSVDISLLIE